MPSGGGIYLQKGKKGAMHITRLPTLLLLPLNCFILSGSPKNFKAQRAVARNGTRSPSQTLGKVIFLAEGRAGREDEEELEEEPWNRVTFSIKKPHTLPSTSNLCSEPPEVQTHPWSERIKVNPPLTGSHKDFWEFCTLLWALSLCTARKESSAYKMMISLSQLM